MKEQANWIMSLNKMEWSKLICNKRFGLEHYHDPRQRGGRSEFQRDFDRLVFSSPFRRLQNKTQVFPLPGSVFVHNRLTHSLEVSCVGRSMANEVARMLKCKYKEEPWVESLDAIGEIVAASCLAHDIGNPPFGHSGENAIATFFSEGEGRFIQDNLSKEQWCDLTSFEGNANSFRLLTHQFKGRRRGGFAMTYSTLASVVKYPHESLAAEKGGKFGFFDSEKNDFISIADELEMKKLSLPGEPIAYARHPLVYIVEAADDICYEVMDFEDSHKLKILPAEVITEHLMAFFDAKRRNEMLSVMKEIHDPNEKIAYLRSSVIGSLVEQCALAFVANEDKILEGALVGSLIDNINERERSAYRNCVKLSCERIYVAPEVVDVELAGHRIITSLMNLFIHAVCHPSLSYSKLLLSKIPGQYDINAESIYGKIQAVLDHVSGMTDVYALDLYRKLQGQSLPVV